MAKVKRNLLTEGLSGMIGGMLVFRAVGESTIVAKAPVASAKRSEEQQQHRKRFKDAATFAHFQMADATTKAAYKALVKNRSRVSPYNLAVKDYFKAPDITEIDHSGYSGGQGGTIRVRAVDDFRVKSVSVEILDGNGGLVERGEAVPQTNKVDWVYTSTTAKGLGGGYAKVVARAKDLPGNETTKEEAVL